ncbi:Ycf48-like protein [compost metagenome]
MLAVGFANVNRGCAVSEGGSILTSQDGGQAWTRIVQAPAGTSLKAVSLGDADTVYAVGSNGTVLKSVDGGFTWDIGQKPGGGSAALVSVKFVSPLTGWVATDSGAVYQSDDGGASWQHQITPPQASGLAVLDAANTRNLWLVTAGGAYALSVTGGK